MSESNRWHQLGMTGQQFLDQTGQEALRGAPDNCPCRLKPDPNNVHDSNAVEVLLGTVRVGFINAQQAKAMRQKYGMRDMDIAALECLLITKPRPATSRVPKITNTYIVSARRPLQEPEREPDPWFDSEEEVII